MTALLKTDQATKIFGGLTAVNKVSLEADRGRISGLIGPNGSGKTTLFNLISGVYPLSGGSIYFKDADLTAKTGLRD